LIAAIRANLVKYTAGPGRGRESIERDIRQLLSRAVMSDGILDVFKSAGLDQPDLSILSDEFLAEVGQAKKKNLAVETLRRLLGDEIKARSRSNIVEATKLGDRANGPRAASHSGPGSSADDPQLSDDRLDSQGECARQDADRGS
jgi:type I restriction enzyme R subunit